MTAIKYETIAATVMRGRFVKLTNENALTIPPHLVERVRRKVLTADDLKDPYYPRAVLAHGMAIKATRFESVEGTFVPNGNDVLLVDGVILEFEPLVKAVLQANAIYLLDSEGEIVENSPVFHDMWMDEATERKYNEMENFINSVNA